MTIKYHYDIEQNTPEWAALRRGVVTASNISKILTPAQLKISKATGYLHDFCRQKLDEMSYGGFSNHSMDRGHLEEEIALKIYTEKYGPVRKCGFVENDNYGFKIGCSPDALLGEDSGIQVKSFTPNNQFGNVIDDAIKPEHMMQVQFEMLVTGRKKWEMVYQSSGTHMIRHHITTDTSTQGIILDAVTGFYKRVDDALALYRERVKDETRYTPTPYMQGLYDQLDEEVI